MKLNSGRYKDPADGWTLIIKNGRGRWLEEEKSHPGLTDSKHNLEKVYNNLIPIGIKHYTNAFK